MKTSKKGIEFIKSFEKFMPSTYLCQSNILTIGWGHTKNVRINQTCTQAEAEEWLQEDIAEVEAEINRIEQPLTQNQYDALVSLCFNIGVTAFRHSTLRKKLELNPNDATIKQEFGRWIYSKKKVSKGLQRRRLQEVNIYFS